MVSDLYIHTMYITHSNAHAHKHPHISIYAIKNHPHSPLHVCLLINTCAQNEQNTYKCTRTKSTNTHTHAQPNTHTHRYLLYTNGNRSIFHHHFFFGTNQYNENDPHVKINHLDYILFFVIVVPSCRRTNNETNKKKQNLLCT